MKHSTFHTIKIELVSYNHSIQAGYSDRMLTAYELNDSLKRTGRSWQIKYKHSDWYLRSLKRAKKN